MTMTVINADIRSGASTNATSSDRRNATNRITAIAITAATAAERKELTIVALVASIVTAEPPALGATAVTSLTNWASPAVERARRFGQNLQPRPAVRKHPIPCKRGGKALQGYRSPR